MKELKISIINEKRRQPLPTLGRYTIRGQSKSFLGEIDLFKGWHVDRYSPSLLFLLILIVGLNYLDACFTMIILENGGQELNPIVESLIYLLGEKFWIWKFIIVSFSSIILCRYSQFPWVKLTIFLLCFLYVGLVSYQFIGLIINI
jgi:hypothetical protein